MENIKDARQLARKSEGQDGQVLDVVRKPGKTKPPKLFDLTALQRLCNRRFGYSAQKTLDLAQALYEEKKLITYPRTDSRYITTELFNEIDGRIYAIHKIFESTANAASRRISEAVGPKSFECVNDKKVTDHHAIIVTTKEAKKVSLSNDEWNVYMTVAQRFGAAFMAPAEFFTTTLWVEVAGERFKTAGKMFIEKGWLEAESWRQQDDKPVPLVDKGDQVSTRNIEVTEKATKPPKFFTEASLLEAMETCGKKVDDAELRDAMKEKGLGTPATRAGIIERLLTVKYIVRKKKSVVATEKGFECIRIVDALHPELSSPELTGQWEYQLRQMDLNKGSFDEFMADIRTYVKKGIASGKAAKVVFKGGKGGSAIGKCPICGKDMMEKQVTVKGRKKTVYSCAGFQKDGTGCSLSIWSDAFKGKITRKHVDQLLTKKKTARPLKLKNKEGTEYKAYLLLNDEGKLDLEFPKTKGNWKRKK